MMDRMDRRGVALILLFIALLSVVFGYGIIIKNKGITLDNGWIEELSGDLNINDNVNVAGYVKAQSLVDKDNTSYYVDPSNTGTSAVIAGNVGIGTTSPSTKLHVVSNNIRLEGTNPTGAASPEIEFRESGRSQYWILDKRGSSFTGQPDWLLFSYYDGSSWHPALYMLPTSTVYFPGSVGIGTSSPGSKLDVSGEIRGTKFTDRDNTGYYVDPAGTSKLHEVETGDLVFKNGFRFVEEGNNAIVLLNPKGERLLKIDANGNLILYRGVVAYEKNS